MAVGHVPCIQKMCILQYCVHNVYIIACSLSAEILFQIILVLSMLSLL